MVSVEPVQFIPCEQFRLDQAALNGAEGQCFKSHHRTLAAFDVFAGMNEQQVFDADAEGALLVESGFIGQDHAWFKNRAV